MFDFMVFQCAISAVRLLTGRLEHSSPSRTAAASHNASTGRSAFADATAAAAALPDEAAADYTQGKRPSKPMSAAEPAATEGQQQTRRGSDKSISSMGQVDQAANLQMQSQRVMRDQVVLKVSMLNLQLLAVYG
jgi:hypothetical protein